MLWIDSVRSLAYQAAKVTARATAKTDRAQPQRDAERVGQVVGDQGADDADQHDREPVDARDVARVRNWTASTTTNTTRHQQRRPAQPQPDVVARKSAAVSPTVVARILITQKKTVTSGTLFSRVRAIRPAASVAHGPSVRCRS